MLSKEKVAYIIVSWNNKELLDECIRSIKEQTHQNHKIILVDNNSSDETVSHVKKGYPEVIICAMQKNYGFAKGNNIGIKHALEDKEVSYVALINTDARIASDWTETILKTAAQKPMGAAFQTITLDYYDHNIIDSTHIYIARNGQATQGSWRRYLPENCDVGTQKVFGCNAAAVIYSRKFIEHQPFKTLFDESMFMYLEDVDVAARATVMNWDNYIVSGSRAYHMGSASSSKNPGFSLYLTFRNNLGMLIKNLPWKVLVKTVPRLIKGDIDTILHLKRIGKKDLIIVILRARVVGLIRVPRSLLQRIRIRRDVDSDYLWELMKRGF